jgi:hypothetical protein
MQLSSLQLWIRSSTTQTMPRHLEAQNMLLTIFRSIGVSIKLLFNLAY